MPAKIIQFKVVKKQQHNQQLNRTINGCKNPIVVERLGRSAATIAFHLAYFATPFLENSLRGLAYGEENTWQLYKIESKDPLYVKYAIALNADFNDKNGKILTAIVDRMSKKVYQKELREKSSEVSLSDLTFPRQYTTSIDNRVKKILERWGVRDALSLSRMTREQICRIPGMTTEDVVRIEKTLASRGIFLTTAYIA